MAAAAAILDNFKWPYLRNGSRSTYIARIARSSLRQHSFLVKFKVADTVYNISLLAITRQRIVRFSRNFVRRCTWESNDWRPNVKIYKIYETQYMLRPLRVNCENRSMVISRPVVNRNTGRATSAVCKQIGAAMILYRLFVTWLAKKILIEFRMLEYIESITELMCDQNSKVLNSRWWTHAIS